MRQSLPAKFLMESIRFQTIIKKILRNCLLSRYKGNYRGGFLDQTEWICGLLAQSEARLIRYARRFVSKESALDIVQEAFLRLCKQKPRSLKGLEIPWLYRVCRNLALDQIKKEKSTLLGQDLNETHTQTPEEDLENQQTNSQLAAAIERLPEPQKEVLLLKFEEGLSYREISSVTGHSESYVGVLIHEAIVKLIKKLNPSTGGEI